VPLFEPYRPQLNDGERPPAIDSVLIRAALPSDVAELATIEAAREGGDVGEHAAKLEKLLASSATGNARVLAAQHGPSLVGIAKATRFTPPAEPPPNIAPAGWYLSGVIVAEGYRRRGIGRRLTQARLSWIAERDRVAYYFANARNRATVELHRPFGFVEITRNFTFPGASFEGGLGILFKAELAQRAGAFSLD
jgi:ribosomal protein S18 acetylase RimI-like enzyme